MHSPTAIYIGGDWNANLTEGIRQGGKRSNVEDVRAETISFYSDMWGVGASAARRRSQEGERRSFITKGGHKKEYDQIFTKTHKVRDHGAALHGQEEGRAGRPHQGDAEEDASVVRMAAESARGTPLGAQVGSVGPVQHARCTERGRGCCRDRVEREGHANRVGATRSAGSRRSTTSWSRSDRLDWGRRSPARDESRRGAARGQGRASAACELGGLRDGEWRWEGSPELWPILVHSHFALKYTGGGAHRGPTRMRGQVGKHRSLRAKGWHWQ